MSKAGAFLAYGSPDGCMAIDLEFSRPLLPKLVLIAKARLALALQQAL